MIDDNQGFSHCLQRGLNASIYVGVSKSNLTDFVLPYLVIHPTMDLNSNIIK